MNKIEYREKLKILTGCKATKQMLVGYKIEYCLEHGIPLEFTKFSKDNYNNEKGVLDHKYANANNPYKIDDIIKDHWDIIKIESIKWRRGGDLESNSEAYPQCVFYGVKLKKDLTPFKSGEKASIFQSNIITEGSK